MMSPLKKKCLIGGKIGKTERKRLRESRHKMICYKRRRSIIVTLSQHGRTDFGSSSPFYRNMAIALPFSRVNANKLTNAFTNMQIFSFSTR